MPKTRFIYTKETNCKGCNKCIFVCPTNANLVAIEAEDSKVHIKNGFCISCGECINICSHNARDYIDDTEEFFKRLKNNENISVIIAPSARFNFTNTPKLISYFKSIGVNNVYDVSFGADITTWGYVKTIKEQNPKSVIAQPCPVVVSFIEKYHPELIENLSSVQSPVICTAIYLKKYLGINDKIALISPCIGKKRECIIEETHGVMNYNITFEKLNNYLANNNIDIESYSEGKFDNMKGSIGFAFPRPGGLSENVKYHLGDDVWIKQIEGINNIERYFKEYIEDLKHNRAVPLIVDALNCEHGCNLGTGSSKTARLNEIDYVTNQNKRDVSDADTKQLMDYFNDNLKIEDFIRKYVDRSSEYKQDDEIDIEGAFIELGKLSKEDREINCFSCGYGSCLEFCKAVARGHNHKTNCRQYMLNKFKKLSLFDELTGLQNRLSYSNRIASIKENFNSSLICISFIDINGLKEVNDVYGHSKGDELIISCANLLKLVFDENAYRVGGDEFIIIENSSNETEFQCKLNQLNELVEKEPLLVISIGKAICRNVNNLDRKIKEADKDMYEVKQAYYRNKKEVDRRHRLQNESAIGGFQ